MPDPTVQVSAEFQELSAVQARTKQMADSTQQCAMSPSAAPRRQGRTVGPTTCGPSLPPKASEGSSCCALYQKSAGRMKAMRKLTSVPMCQLMCQECTAIRDVAGFCSGRMGKSLYRQDAVLPITDQTTMMLFMTQLTSNEVPRRRDVNTWGKRIV